MSSILIGGTILSNRIKDSDIVRLTSKSKSFSDLLKRLEVKGSVSYYIDYLRERIKVLNLDISHFYIKPKTNIFDLNKSRVKETVKKSHSRGEVLQKLGFLRIPTRYRQLNRFIKENKLEISHFKSFKSVSKPLLALKQILVKDSYIDSARLRERLIKEGLKERCCEICKRKKWNTENIPLSLHHVNGDHTDNRLKNLQILCYNCHGQTKNFCSKNRKTNGTDSQM